MVGYDDCRVVGLGKKKEGGKDFPRWNLIWPFRIKHLTKDEITLVDKVRFV